MKYLLIVPIMLLLMTGCNEKFDHHNEGSGTCEAVFMHTPGVYSLMKKEGNSLVPYCFPYGCPDIQLIADVQQGSNLWYEYNYDYDSFFGLKRGWVKIHVHSVNDISTAGWNHSKFGSGETTRIE